MICTSHIFFRCWNMRHWDICAEGTRLRSKLDVCDHCIKSRYDSLHISTWAQKHFRESLFVNAVHRAIQKYKLKLNHAKKKPYVNAIQKSLRLLWAKAHLGWSEANWSRQILDLLPKLCLYFVLFGHTYFFDISVRRNLFVRHSALKDCWISRKNIHNSSLPAHFSRPGWKIAWFYRGMTCLFFSFFCFFLLKMSSGKIRWHLCATVRYKTKVKVWMALTDC